MNYGRNQPCPCGSGRKYKKCCLLSGRFESRSPQPQARRGAPGRPGHGFKVWEMGVLPLAIQLSEEKDARPTSLMVTAGDKIVHGDVLSAPSVEVEDLADLMASHLEAAVQSSGAKPKRLRILEAELVPALSSKMTGALDGIEIVQGPIRNVETAWRALSLHMAEKPASYAVFTDTWAAWGQPDAWVAAAFEAARRFYRCEPWRELDGDHDLIRVEMDGEQNLGVSIMGASGVSYGLTLTTERDELLADFERMSKHRVRPRGKMVTLSFTPRSEMPDAGLREVEARGLPVAGEDAYPQLNVAQTRAGGLPRDRARQFLAVLEAVCDLFEDQRAVEGFMAGETWSSADGALRLSLAGG